MQSENNASVPASAVDVFATVSNHIGRKYIVLKLHIATKK